MERHILIHTGEKPFQCTYCKKSYAQKAQLDEHVNIHTNSKPYKCDVCNKGFNYRNSLRNHKKTHGSDDRFRVKVSAGPWDTIYECNTCKYTVNNRTVMSQHVKQHEKPVFEPTNVIFQGRVLFSHLSRKFLITTQELNYSWKG